MVYICKLGTKWDRAKKNWGHTSVPGNLQILSCHATEEKELSQQNQDVLSVVT